MAITIGESATAGYLGLLNPITGTAYNAVQTLVTNDASQDKEVSAVLFKNFHTSAVTVNIYYLPNNAGAVRTPASEDDYKIWECAIPAPSGTESGMRCFDIPVYLAATNDTIRVYASTTSVVLALANGYEKS